MSKTTDEAAKILHEDNRKRTHPFEGLESQCQTEYTMAWKHQKEKKDEWMLRLKLYNNQKRDKEAVGDTTMFSIFQTILASLYDDQLEVTFKGQEAGDEDAAENLNALAVNDYSAMQKDQMDFEWDWDTLFFGHGIVEEEEYQRSPEKNVFLPIPRVLDPITFLRDPYASSINGDLAGRGACRFFGYEDNFLESELHDNESIFSDLDYQEVNYGGGAMSILKDAIQARADAQGLTNQRNEIEKKLGANAQYACTVWYTNWKTSKGNILKLKVYLANDRAKLIGFKILKEDYWPLVDRKLYPHSHDWDGTSIPDLTEDKQRARAVAQNLGLKAMKADLYPNYIYDSNKITNRHDLDFNFNKFIPVDAKGESVANAIQPMIKARPNMNLLDFIYTSLDVSAQKATSTPDIQQGAQSSKERTLGEINLISSKVDTRYSLSAKIFGWSEKTFWKFWYQLHKTYFADDIDEKVLRIEGAFGPKWRPLTKADLTTKNFDPDITIESRIVNRSKQMEERQTLTGYLSLVLQDPTANRRYALKEMGKMSGLTKDKIDRLFPPTIDEREAEAENEKLNKNEVVPVTREQNHIEHLDIHAKGNLTNAMKAHIFTHEKALMIRRTNPELFPEMAAQDQQNQQTAAGGQTPPAGAVPSATNGVPRPPQATAGAVPAAYGG